jgi:hypothetical protein
VIDTIPVAKPLLVQKWADFPMYMPMAGPSDDSAPIQVCVSFHISNFRFKLAVGDVNDVVPFVYRALRGTPFKDTPQAGSRI